MSVVPRLKFGLVIPIAINQIEKLYQCIYTRFCILVDKKVNFDIIIIIFKIESSDHGEDNHKLKPIILLFYSKLSR